MATICLHESKQKLYLSSNRGGENRRKFYAGMCLLKKKGPAFGAFIVACRSGTELRFILALIKGELRWKMTARPSFINLHVVPNPNAVVILVGREKINFEKFPGCSLKPFGTYDVKLQNDERWSVWFVLYFESSEAVWQD